ncbi:MAG: Crp/Fnr family transcriptional regulator [Niastella sp.]|nr:Crp/Fnr family transcriptional regulator [Niastella sp.]
MDILLRHLESIHPLSDELREYLLNHVRCREITKRDYLLKAGSVSRHVCFIVSGLLRCFYVKNDSDAEVSSWFMKEGDVVFSIESFYTQTPSYESIQALEDTQVFYISFEELEFIYQQFPEFNFIGRVLTIHYHKLWGEQLYSIRMHTGKQRYEWLLNNHAELLQRVPAKYLASYLDITEISLSRIKGQL